MKLKLSIACAIGCLVRIFTNIKFIENWLDPVTMTYADTGQPVERIINFKGGNLFYIGIAFFEALAMWYISSSEKRPIFKMFFNFCFPLAGWDFIKQTFLDRYAYDVWEYWGLLVSIILLLYEIRSFILTFKKENKLWNWKLLIELPTQAVEKKVVRFK